MVQEVMPVSLGRYGRYGEQWGAAEEALLACLSLTSCCAAGSQQAADRYWSTARGLGTPALKGFASVTE